MSGLQITGLVLGILLLVGGVQATVWLLLAKRLVRMADALRAELEAGGERIVRGPERALYRGATAEHGRVTGLGLLVLTDRRLVFRKVIGKPIELERASLAGSRTAKTFLGSYMGGKLTWILRTHDGVEIGFMVPDDPAWSKATLPAA